MRSTLFPLLAVAGLFGCGFQSQPTTDTSKDGGTICPPQPDLLQPTAKCAAAKGLSGDILGDLCLDMDKIDTQGLTSRGFDLTASKTNCAGWEVAAGKLQPKSINTAGGPVKCGLLFPNLPFDGAKYPRIMLSVMQQANLPIPTQQARMDLFDASSPLRVWVNPSTTVAQRTIVEIDTINIPSGFNAQTSIELGAPMGSPTPSWTISSIAVIGQSAQ